MLDRVVHVKYLNIKNNFCYLGPALTKELALNGVVYVSVEGNKKVYFSVGPLINDITDNTIGINSLSAKILGIEEGITIVLTKGDVPSKVQSFTIHPIRPDDFHVLDLLKNEVENSVLQQTNIVSDGQEFIIWLGDNLNIPVKVVSVEPTSPGLLNNLTELVILPFKRSESPKRDIMTDEKIPKVSGKDQQIKSAGEFFCLHEKLTQNEAQLDTRLTAYFNKLDSISGRLVPFTCLETSKINNYLYDFSIFLLKSNVPHSWQKLESFKLPIFCSVELNNDTNPKRIFARIFLIEKDILEYDGVLENNIFVHDNLFTILNCTVGANAILKVQKLFTCDEIFIHTRTKDKTVENLLKDFLAKTCQNQEFVLNADVPIILDEDVYCSLKFEPHSKYCCVNEEFLRNCKYTVVEDSSVQKLPISKKLDCTFLSVPPFQLILNTIMKNLKIQIVDGEELSCSLITGSMGCGKSTLLNMIASNLKQFPLYLYCEVVKCKTLKGKSIDSLSKVFEEIFRNLVSHKPSVLLIDDLHILCENIMETDAQVQNILYFDRNSEMLYSLFESIVSLFPIGIIATAESTEKLNKNIYDPRGCYLFGDVYNIGELTMSNRNIILKNFLQDYSENLDFDDLAHKTEGYVFQDLFDFSQKAIFQSIKEGKDFCETCIVTKQHCQEVLSRMTTLSLSELKLHTSGYRDFSNVGGMTDIKEILVQTLIWPLKYPNLFNAAPIRLQSGILLYGPPGTGKTLLAGATAKQFSIRLISIKGPELLSKYIGASEQAVRNVFVQAQNAKPCILFFDEFDSLAPRRGHDSTGVTDRVVNQLLTQMDGVESLTGVFVVAATSRPDLLDPALLRPGRLDKKIFCPLPDLDARLDIMNVLSKTLNVSKDVNMKEIAEKTNGFSGADLQSLLYTAQLTTMENLLSKDSQNEDVELQPITQESLRNALAKTKPSLSREEKQKYGFIYSKFHGNETGTHVKPGTKASLA